MSSSRWTAEDIPDQSGRVALVTGANTGLGFDTARAFAQHGATVVLAVRDEARGAAAADRIAAEVPAARLLVQPLDLGSLAAVREAAAAVRDRHDRLDLLVNNAGVMYTPFGRTADGFERQFGTNHLGHFALTGLLLDRLLATPGSRVVTVSSVGHRIRSRFRFEDLHSEHRYSRTAAYGRAKLANLLFTYELQRRLAEEHAGTVAVAAHPGVAATELGRNSPAPLRTFLGVLHPLLQSAELGALPTLRAATDPEVGGGTYYGPGGLGEVSGPPVLVSSSRRSHDRALQARLWAVSEELTGVRYDIAAAVASAQQAATGTATS